MVYPYGGSDHHAYFWLAAWRDSAAALLRDLPEKSEESKVKALHEGT